jgi:hypothetical protein
MTLGSSCYLTVNVPYVHLLLQYRPQLDVSLPPKDNSKLLASCILSENLPQFNFREFPAILNVPTSINPVELNHMSMETIQLVHLCLSTDQEAFDSGTYGQ